MAIASKKSGTELGNIEKHYVQNFGGTNSVFGFVGGLKQKLTTFFYNLTFKALSKPSWLLTARTFFALVRPMFPVARIGKTSLVSGHYDIKEVLNNMSAFNSAYTMDPKMPAGSFVLSTDWPLQHERELSVLREAFMVDINEDAKNISAIVRAKARTCIDAGFKAAGNSNKMQFNLAADYTESVALEIVERYLGVFALKTNEDPKGNRSRGELRNWLRILAAQIFTPPVAGTPKQAITAAASAGLIAHIHKCMDTLRPLKSTKLSASDTLLLRLMKISKREALSKKRKESKGVESAEQWIDDDWICRLLAGMMVAGNATVARAETQAFYRLLTLSQYNVVPKENRRSWFHLVARSKAITYAVDAALAYRKRPNGAKRGSLLQVVYEGLRFHPMLPILSPRLALRDTYVAAQTDKTSMITAGQVVFPFVIGAMFDPDVFKKPSKFMIGRPLGDYLHFGWGPHMCFGKFVADIQFVETASELFGNPKLKVHHRRGRSIEYQGPAVVRYLVDVERVQ